MNPVIWRLMGGVTVASTVDHLIPGYATIAYAGVGAAMPEGTKRAGARHMFRKGLEGIGKAQWKVLTSPKHLSFLGKMALRAPSRLIPIVGWSLLAYDVGNHFYQNPDQLEYIVEEHRSLQSQGPYYMGKGMFEA